jgi:hypothetical protein
MDLHDAVVDFDTASSLGQDDWFGEVRLLSSPFGVNSDHRKSIPDLLQQDF